MTSGGKTESRHPIVVQQQTALFDDAHPLLLESGMRLAPVSVAYETHGTLNASGDNAILVCHALTGSAHVAGFASDDPTSAGWWDPMIGPGRPLDTDRYFVVCSNFLGGCYGTTGPASTNPATGKRYGIDFPAVTVRDVVKVQHELLQHLGVHRLATVVGGSLGGMQVLEWGAMFPGEVASTIPIATAAQHSPWCIGLNDIARQAIMNDPDWMGGDYPPDRQPERGLSLARQIAMISYRSDVSFMERFHRDVAGQPKGATLRDHLGVLYQAESYLRYQGTKLVHRFDANTYLSITRTMDSHDLARNRGALEDVLAGIALPALCVGINSDVLYPAEEQKRIADGLAGGIYYEIDSIFGHDAFLIEYDQLGGAVSAFLKDLA
jgi:homoserine O-acetyltransferase/O-succinyltransferase